jgi:hypothetical protein
MKMRQLEEATGSSEEEVKQEVATVCYEDEAARRSYRIL